MNAINDFENFGGEIKIIDGNGVDYELESCNYYDKEIILYF